MMGSLDARANRIQLHVRAWLRFADSLCHAPELLDLDLSLWKYAFDLKPPSHRLNVTAQRGTVNIRTLLHSVKGALVGLENRCLIDLC